MVDVLVPAKDWSRAKSRLGPRLDAAERSRLAEAMLNDVLSTLVGSPSVDSVAVIAGSDAIARTAGGHGARILDEATCLAAHGAAPLTPGRASPEARLNMLLAGAARLARQRGSMVAVVHADLPAARPSEIETALGQCRATGATVVVADRHGRGSTMLVHPPGRAARFRFGPDSARSHRLDGARDLVIPAPGLRTDIDSIADIEAARAIGVGRFTAEILGSLPFFGHVVKKSPNVQTDRAPTNLLWRDNLE
ncbi:2-phospho-L-lactate guanylyltransferase [Hoyosella sp. G463]|uniref:Phosphoenolpyruvate guanylyltransferase n=1 Tax=Lolliginicoccus lacisalsi TaxID=2742202 RepID=A0A927JEI3_9ACTN|nr:2-phospho-L-lactate guanylyltransferase [Lolliginicoccus lacisalsi]